MSMIGDWAKREAEPVKDVCETRRTLWLEFGKTDPKTDCMKDSTQKFVFLLSAFFLLRLHSVHLITANGGNLQDPNRKEASPFAERSPTG